MTPKAKALELVDKFEKEIPIDIGNSHEDVRSADANVLDISKKCALIAVDEILKVDIETVEYCLTDEELPRFVSYWQKVKQEIEKL